MKPINAHLYCPESEIAMSSKITSIAGILWSVAILTLILYRCFQNEIGGVSFIIFLITAFIASLLTVVALIQASHRLMKGSLDRRETAGGIGFWAAVLSFFISVFWFYLEFIQNSVYYNAQSWICNFLRFMGFFITTLSLPTLLFYFASIIFNRERRMVNMALFLIMSILEALMIYIIWQNNEYVNVVFKSVFSPSL